MMYAISMSDGSVAIMTTVDGVVPEDCIAKWTPEMRAVVVSIQPIDQAAIPADRTFRNAWRMNAGSVDHDMAKARDIQRDRLRTDRARRFVQLDADWMKATRQKDTATADAIEAERQKMRDAPADPRIEAARTPEVLKVLTLDTVMARTRE